jgi:carboxyl-terminal processing protease
VSGHIQRTARSVQRTILWAAVALVAVVACTARPQPAPAPAYDAAVGLATFDSAWQLVYATHFDTTFNGVDWRALKGELRSRAETAATTAALRAVVDDMLERLGQSHFSLIPRELADTLNPVAGDSTGTGDVGLDIRLVGDELTVTSVEDGGPAHAAGIRPGWVLMTVGRDSVAAILRRLREEKLRYADGFYLWATVQRRLGGAVGSSVTVTTRDADDRPRELTLVRRPAPSEPVKFGNLPTFFARFARDERATPAGRRVGRIWFNFWMPVLLRQVDEAVDAFRGTDGIIIDLRGNRGGAGAMVMGVAGHFLADRVSLGEFRTRRNTLHFRANPRLVNQRGERVEPFRGPVAILVDETSGSASEVFAGGMQAISRVRVFGATSLGGVLPAVFDRLPNGDVLYHAIADFATAKGVVLEGRGVIPDVPVQPSRADLLAGRDPVLDAALAWIDLQASSSQSPEE